MTEYKIVDSVCCKCGNHSFSVPVFEKKPMYEDERRTYLCCTHCGKVKEIKVTGKEWLENV